MREIEKKRERELSKRASILLDKYKERKRERQTDRDSQRDKDRQMQR